MEFPYLWLFAASFATSFVAMPLVRRIGSSIGLLDHPHERKIQAAAVPRTGGIGVLCGLVAGFAVLAVLGRGLGIPLGREIFAICVGGILIHAVGVMDDLWDIPARVKLLAQSAAVGVVVSQGVLIEQFALPGLGSVSLGVLSIPFTVFFLLGLVNCINLVDGLDGLASGIAAIGAMGLGIAGLFGGNAVLAALAVTLFGAVLGFLPYNVRGKGKTFLGDAGSMLLGWTLGVTAIMGARFGGDSTPIVVVLAAASVAILDTTTTILRRSRSQQAIFVADSMHVHHRLIRFGMTPRGAVLTILALTLSVTAQALAIFVEGTRGLLIPATLAVVLVIVQIQRPRRLNLVESDASFREVLFYLLGAQTGKEHPRLSGELAIVDLLRETAANGSPASQASASRATQAVTRPTPAAPPSEREETAPARKPVTH